MHDRKEEFVTFSIVNSSYLLFGSRRNAAKCTLTRENVSPDSFPFLRTRGLLQVVIFVFIPNHIDSSAAMKLTIGPRCEIPSIVFIK